MNKKKPTHRKIRVARWKETDAERADMMARELIKLNQSTIDFLETAINHLYLVPQAVIEKYLRDCLDVANANMKIFESIINHKADE